MGKFCGWGGGRITGTRLLLPGWCWGHGVLSTLPPLPGGTAPAFPGPQGVRKGAGSPSGCRGRSRAAPGWASLMGEFVGWVLSLCPRMGQPLFILYNKRSSSSPAVLLPALLLSPPACSCTLRVPGPQPPPSTGTEQVSFTHTHTPEERRKSLRSSLSLQRRTQIKVGPSAFGPFWMKKALLTLTSGLWEGTARRARGRMVCKSGPMGPCGAQGKARGH